nr:MAG TPA: hypothetical protein [Caudoviricetes sp.]
MVLEISCFDIPAMLRKKFTAYESTTFLVGRNGILKLATL